MSHWLNAEQAHSYSCLTTPALAQALRTVTVPTVDGGTVVGLHAAAVRFAGQPAGLAVLQQSPATSITLVSLAVAEPFQRLGLARQLLDWLVAEAPRLGWSSLMVSYPLNHGSTAAMERLTNPIGGWQHSPGLRLVHFDRDAGSSIVTRLAPLVTRWQRRGRWSFVLWQDLEAEMLLQVKTMQQQAPDWAWPDGANYQELLGERDDALSQVLLDRGAVAGWLIAHRIGKSRCRISQWWVTPKLQGTGAALLLLHHAIARALIADPQYLFGCFGVATQSQSMRQISAGFLEPLATSIQENQRATIRFQP